MYDIPRPSGAPVLLDPTRVHISSVLRFRFRPPQAFMDSGFAELKRSVAQLSGNVQPIKVRPLRDGGHELVFGTRRLQACLELGLPVAAVVEDLTMHRVVQELDASNDDTQVSLYERGCLYDSLLLVGIYPSRRRLAEALGRSLVEVSSAIAASQLPREIVNCIVDPRALTAGTVKRLTAAVAVDPESVSQRLAKATIDGKVGVKAILNALSA